MSGSIPWGVVKWILSGARRRGYQGNRPEKPLRYFVIDTGKGETTAAILAAGTLARGLSAQMTLLAAVEVPFPIPLDEPPVSIAFLEQQAIELVMQSEIPGRVELRLCRDRNEAIRRALPPQAMVVLGGRGRWFGSWTRKLARMLVRDGHRVFVVGGFQNS